MSYESRIKRGIRPLFARHNIILLKIILVIMLCILPFVYLVYGFIEQLDEMKSSYTRLWDELLHGD